MKLTLAALFVACIGIVTLQAMAVKDTIKFIGGINDHSCLDTLNGSGANTTVDLGSVHASSLAPANDTADYALFTPQLIRSAGPDNLCDQTRPFTITADYI